MYVKKNSYEPASVASLYAEMDITPQSLYCCFGNKAKLLLEAVCDYENAYRREPADRMMCESDVYKTVEVFFHDAVRIMLSPHLPCGCMIILVADNIPPKETRIKDAIRTMRMETEALFSKRLASAIMDG